MMIPARRSVSAPRRWLGSMLVLVAIAASACGSRRADDPALATVDATVAASAVATVATVATTDGETTTTPPAPTVLDTTTELPPSSLVTAASTSTAASTAPTVAAKPAAPIAPPPDDAVEPTNQIGRIEIPKLGIDMAMYEGITLSTLDQGPGHWPGTAMPGQIGNVVVAGHRVSHTRPFRNIDKLVAGDLVIFTVQGVRYTYAVTGSEVVTPDRVDIVKQTPTATATLFACHPPGSTRYRWVTRLVLVTA